ncbi:MAG: transporter substrate-binding domain-containing protein [Pseudomonadota bacterium]
MTRFLIAAALAAGIALPASAEQMQLRIGTEGAYPPFNYFDSDNNLIGFDIDIAKALCAEMNAECEFITQDWDGIIPALMANKFDAIIASMSITAERDEVIDFSKKYYNTPPALAKAKDRDDLTTGSAEELDGMIIGAQSATTHANFAEQYYPDSELRRYGTPEEYKLDLANGRVDVVIDDIVVLSDWLASEDGACCEILVPLTPDPEINGAGAGIAVREGETELAEKFNAAIEAIRADGTYAQIQAKYFDFDVYGD